MQADICGIGPIHSAHLLRRVDGQLLELLASLTTTEWDLPTIAGVWTVRDVAAHLLDTPLRKLSLVRDACFVEPANIHSRQDLVQLIDRLNREGVAVYRRLSPPLLIEMMQLACEQSARFHESLDAFAAAAFPVSWAGEDTSPNWFDTARELTERWHHQQQIRLATNRPGIMTRELYHPVLDCFLRGLPFAYRDVDAPSGTAVLVEIPGNCGGRWFLLRGSGRESTGSAKWTFASPLDGHVESRVTIPQELAWRVFTRGVDHDSARAQIEITGNRDLGEAVLHLTAIVA